MDEDEDGENDDMRSSGSRLIRVDSGDEELDDDCSEDDDDDEEDEEEEDEDEDEVARPQSAPSPMLYRSSSTSSGVESRVLPSSRRTLKLPIPAYGLVWVLLRSDSATARPMQWSSNC